LKGTEVIMNKFIRTAQGVLPTLLALVWETAPGAASAPLILIERLEG
jgi:hypothetical protein